MEPNSFRDSCGSASASVPCLGGLDSSAIAIHPTDFFPSGNLDEWMQWSDSPKLGTTSGLEVFSGLSTQGGSDMQKRLVRTKSFGLWTERDESDSNSEWKDEFDFEGTDLEMHDGFELTPKGTLEFLRLLRQPNPLAAETIEDSKQVIDRKTLSRLGKESIETTIMVKPEKDE